MTHLICAVVLYHCVLPFTAGHELLEYFVAFKRKKSSSDVMSIFYSDTDPTVWLVFGWQKNKKNVCPLSGTSPATVQSSI